MKTQRKRTVISRAVGAGLVIGGTALTAMMLTGAQAPQVSDNAQVGDWVWLNTQGLNTIGTTSVNPFPSDTIGSTVVGFPVPSIGVPGGDGSGNTVVWLPGTTVVTGTFVR